MKTSKKLLSVLLALLMLTSVLSAAFSVSAVDLVSNIELTCPAPAPNGDFPVAADVTCGDALKVERIYISEVVNETTTVKATAPFESGKSYEIIFTMETKSVKYNFEKQDKLSASVNGESCNVVYLNRTTANVVWNVTVTDKPTAPTTPANQCKWCGGEHVGFFGGILGWFHNILAAIFGARY